MRTNHSLACALALTAAGLACSLSTSSAQFFAKDDASNYTNNAPGNAAWLESSGTTNGGFGFTPWTYTRGGSNFQGYYLGNGGQPASIEVSNKFWGMYANGGSNNNVAVAYRGFTNSLQTNTVFKIKWKPNGIGFNTTQLGGFALRNGNANATTNDYFTGYRFAFYYQGGGSDSYLVADGNGVNLIGLGFGTAPFDVEVTLLAPDTYRLVVKDGTGANTLYTADNQPLANSSQPPAGSGTIDSLAMFAVQTDGDQIFNNLEISSTSLVPPDIANVAPTNNSIYVDTTLTQVSFDVSSVFSTVASNQIKLTLNGVNQTNLTFSGFSTNWHVVLNSALVDNLVYNGVITAQDANGNRATNNFTFNTWRSDCPFIEAEDYNFTGGHFIRDSFPDSFNAYAGLIGSNGVDYLEYDTFGVTNAYRTGDLPQLESAVDADHAGYVGFGYSDYDLAYIKRFEFENYTRIMTNATYDVYARVSGFGNSPTMLLEHLADATGSSSNQPRASLGTFVIPNTGGPQNWAFVPLKDFFSQPVQIHFAGTNTFRTTSLADDGSYNFNYLIFVPSANAATLRPYLSAGFPFSGVNNASPDQSISFTIANRQTSVSPGSIQLTLNGTNVTGSLALESNAAGTVVTYQPVYPNLLPAGTNTAQVVFSDGSVLQTNQWQFTVANLPTIPAAYAVPANEGAGLPGFAIQIAKADDNATNADFPPTIARAVAHLAGQITNALTGLPYPNLAAGTNNGFFDETNTINYDINATPDGNSTFQFKTNFPYIPASGTNNFISMAADMYVQLSAGVNTFAVRSDDGFLLAAGPTLGSTNLSLGLFDAGRGDNVPTTFSFIVQSNGLYPMRLIYDQGEFGGNIELYSTTGGQNILLNDRSNPNAVKTFRTVLAASLQILNPGHSGNSSTFSFASQNGQSYTILFKKALTDPVWLTNGVVTGNGGTFNYTDTSATNGTRFYQIRTP